MGVIFSGDASKEGQRRQADAEGGGSLTLGLVVVTTLSLQQLQFKM